MRKHYEQMIRDTEKRARHHQKTQNLDVNSPYYGAFVMPNGVYMQKHALYCIADIGAVYCNAESGLYHNEDLLASMLRGLDYVRSTQHENGLFDYITCNFFSAPDTAFCIGIILHLAQYLKRREVLDDGEAMLLEKLDAIIHDGGRGLLEGGFHTPNHRWAIAALLATCGKLYGEEDLTQAAFAYLNEGIDCNDDGEYSEKSAGNYNSVNNQAMLLLADALGDDSYEQHVIRNLRMMLTYWEPDDSIFTANSTRFDKDRLVYPDGYYWFYLYLGAKYNIPEFAAMANYIFEIVREKNILSPNCLIRYMLYPELIDFESELSGTPREYHAYYADSGIARVRKGKYTYTVMKDKSNFLWVHNGSIKLAVKIGGSFCEIVTTDYVDGTILLGHDGPFHLAIAKGKPYLRGLGLYHGKQGSGVSVEAKVRPGAITNLGCTQTIEGTLKLTITEAEATDGTIMTIGNTQTPVRFKKDPDAYMDEWFAEAPTHHFAMSVGHNGALFEKIGQLLQVPYVVLDK